MLGSRFIGIQANSVAPSRIRFRAIVILATIVLGGDSLVARACNVPIFRYALERWSPDPYELTLFSRGPLSEIQQAWLREWRQRWEKELPNISLRLVDVDDFQQEADRELFQRQAKSDEESNLPWLTVKYPGTVRNELNQRNETVIWAGPFSRAESGSGAIDQVLSSHLRTELVRRLSGGQTVVWLLLECADAEKNQAAAVVLQEELEFLNADKLLANSLDVPKEELWSQVPLKIAFSLLRIPHNADSEKYLGKMLRHGDPALADNDGPIAFPVFGRGRVLHSLASNEINATNIRTTAAYLIGECHCETKNLNPGFDLLLSADWEKLLFDGRGYVPVSVQTESADFASVPQYVAIAPGNRSANQTPIARGDAINVEPVTRSASSVSGSRIAILATVGLSFVALLVLGSRLLFRSA